MFWLLSKSSLYMVCFFKLSKNLNSLKDPIGSTLVLAVIQDLRDVQHFLTIKIVRYELTEIKLYNQYICLHCLTMT